MDLLLGRSTDVDLQGGFRFCLFEGGKMQPNFENISRPLKCHLRLLPWGQLLVDLTCKLVAGGCFPPNGEGWRFSPTIAE